MEASVATGFRFHNELITVDQERAERWLKSRKQRRFTSAHREGGGIAIEKHFFVCPCCGQRVPAYPAYFYPRQKRPPRIAPSEAERLCSPQTSLFEGQALLINEPIREKSALICPRCEQTSAVSDSRREYSLAVSDEGLRIQCALRGPEELTSLKWLSREDIPLRGLRLYESILLDPARGRVCVTLSDEQTTLEERELEASAVLGDDDPCLSLLRCKASQRAIRKAFAAIYPNPLPFPEAELRADHYILLCLFVGYERAFYEGLPYSPRRDELIIPSFSRATAALHLAADVPDLYARSGLPGLKSVKRFVLEHPQFLVFLTELEQLWQLFPDPNMFCALLQSRRSPSILSFLHRYDQGVAYLSMLRDIMGMRWLCRRLMEDKGVLLFEDSARYASLNEYARDQIRVLLQEGRRSAFYDLLYEDPGLSLVTYTADKNIPDCTIRGYRFRRLKSPGDFQEAGIALNNCLAKYAHRKRCVIAVIKEQQYMAAVEIEGRAVVEASLAECEDIRADSKLHKAFLTWCAKYGLSLPKKGREYVPFDEI